MTDGWKDQILDFWFNELTPDEWYSGGAKVDELIRSRFEQLYAELAQEMPLRAMNDAKTALATIIVFDQFPRNMFRGTARAFATDPQALAIARNAFEQGFDRGMTKAERQFLAMPLMHSETLADQQRCVKVFEQIGEQENLKYAVEHHDIVQKFGRFPHRNRALGRQTTSEEQAFLEGHEGYGQ